MKIRELFEEKIFEIATPPLKFKGSVIISNDGVKSLKDRNLPNKITGSFDCSQNSLKNLEGSPEEIKGDFNCSNNKNLTSLKGMPQIGIKELKANECNLKTLEGSPQRIKGDFNCLDNKKLKSLNGMPQIGVEGVFADGCDFTSLEGAPKKIKGTFAVSENHNLTSLKGMPQIGVTDIYCANCNIISLEGVPSKISGELYCSDNMNLSSLKGCPKEVKNLFIDNCNITSLEGAPKKIRNLLALDGNPIKSLKGIHKIIEEIEDLILPHSIESNILGILKIRNLRKVSFKSFGSSANVSDRDAQQKDQISKIINKYLPNPTMDQIIDCQNELIDAGFEEYAEL